MGKVAKGEFLADLRSNVPVSTVVTYFQEMRVCAGGKQFVGRSPFTGEKTPSFFVFDERGFYHDFSSGRHGDVLSYLIKAVQMSPQEAVEIIQSISGHTFIPAKFQRQRKKRRRTRRRGI